MIFYIPFEHENKEKFISLNVSRSTIDVNRVDYIATVNGRDFEIDFLYEEGKLSPRNLKDQNANLIDDLMTAMKNNSGFPFFGLPFEYNRPIFRN